VRLASSHEERLRGLVDDLVADLRPVKRIWTPETNLGFWLAVELLVFGLVASLALRMDVMGQLAHPLFLLELALLIAAGGLSAAMALLAAVPGREPSPGAVALALGLLAASLVCLHQEMPAAARTLASAPWGMSCALETIGIALVPWATLLFLARRGASLVPVVAGGLAGLAAFLLAAATMRVVCPVDNLWHLVIWHFSPVVIGLGLSSLIGVGLLRAWRDEA